MKKKDFDCNTGNYVQELQVSIGAGGEAEGMRDFRGKCFPIWVMATMSSGKSTLINAILGAELLPSKNEACTARPCRVYSLEKGRERLVIYKNRYRTRSEITRLGARENVIAGLRESIAGANEDGSVDEICFYTPIKDLISRYGVVITDTPGTNNSLDSSHEQVTDRELDGMKTGLVIYLINAEQLGINDDKALLLKLRRAVDESEGLSVIFVINKSDSIDEERESLEQFVAETEEYLIGCGFESPEIIPVSALAALLFKRALSGESLTRRELLHFRDYLSLYKSEKTDLTSYAVTQASENWRGEITVGGSCYRRSEVYAALKNTGVPYLTDAVQRCIFFRELKKKGPVKRKEGLKK